MEKIFVSWKGKKIASVSYHLRTNYLDLCPIHSFIIYVYGRTHGSYATRAAYRPISARSRHENGQRMIDNSGYHGTDGVRKFALERRNRSIKYEKKDEHKTGKMNSRQSHIPP